MPIPPPVALHHHQCIGALTAGGEDPLEYKEYNVLLRPQPDDDGVQRSWHLLFLPGNTTAGRKPRLVQSYKHVVDSFAAPLTEEDGNLAGSGHGAAHGGGSTPTELLRMRRDSGDGDSAACAAEVDEAGEANRHEAGGGPAVTRVLGAMEGMWRKTKKALGAGLCAWSSPRKREMKERRAWSSPTPSQAVPPPSSPGSPTGRAVAAVGFAWPRSTPSTPPPSKFVAGAFVPSHSGHPEARPPADVVLPWLAVAVAIIFFRAGHPR
uniref:Uncharacterized protein n=1 Tax=Oryza sativa subsp. japonica TaxID=39947 RepID=Q652F5_ORYSJ|nr:hypothetical protein [Oryza sativa Japonica Group]BAD46312.1 hypothetical protein [Oryza sativa Japonica Group]